MHLGYTRRWSRAPLFYADSGAQKAEGPSHGVELGFELGSTVGALILSPLQPPAAMFFLEPGARHGGASGPRTTRKQAAGIQPGVQLLEKGCSFLKQTTQSRSSEKPTHEVGASSGPARAHTRVGFACLRGKAVSCVFHLEYIHHHTCHQRQRLTFVVCSACAFSDDLTPSSPPAWDGETLIMLILCRGES